MKPTTNLTPKTTVFKALVYALAEKNKKNSKKFGALADDIAIHLSDAEVEVVKSTAMEAAHLIRDFSWATIITDDDLSNLNSLLTPDCNERCFALLLIFSQPVYLTLSYVCDILYGYLQAFYLLSRTRSNFRCQLTQNQSKSQK